MSLGNEISRSMNVQQAIAQLLTTIRADARDKGVITVDLFNAVDADSKLQRSLESAIENTFNEYYGIKEASAAQDLPIREAA